MYTISQEELQIKHGSGHERRSCKQAARMHVVFRQPIRSNPFSCAHLSEMILFTPLKLGGGGCGGGGPGRAALQGVVDMRLGQRRGEGVRRTKNLISALSRLLVGTEVKAAI